MHAIPFSSKRVFHAFMRVMRKPLKSLAEGLTPARFDMLYVLLTGSGTSFFLGGKTTQKEVRRALGVSASVVSRMLRALEKLGWVIRRPWEGDRRQREVRLTEAGLACIRAAHQALKGAAKKLVYLAICFGRHRDAGARFEHMCTLEDGYLRSLRRQWGDTAAVHFPWGLPDH